MVLQVLGFAWLWVARALTRYQRWITLQLLLTLAYMFFSSRETPGWVRGPALIQPIVTGGERSYDTHMVAYFLLLSKSGRDSSKGGEVQSG